MNRTPYLVAILALTALFPSPSFAAQDDCRAAPARQDRIETVGARGELVLASGERAVLSGVRWPDDEAGARGASAWLLQYRDRPLTIVQRGAQDRWGRARIDAAAEADSEQDLVNGQDLASGQDLAGGLISAGLVLTDAGEGDALCRPQLLALEKEVRAGASGVWAAPVRDPRDGAAIQSIEGDFIVAEGRVLNVGERRSRTYLDFARWGETGLTVTVPKRTWRIMRERGLTAATLKGRLVRVRGRVEVWRGPVLDIASADLIEMLEGEQALRRRP